MERSAKVANSRNGDKDFFGKHVKRDMFIAKLGLFRFPSAVFCLQRLGIPTLDSS